MLSPTLSAGSADITPDWPVPLAGRQRRHGLCTGVHDSLELNAVLVRDAGATLAIMTADLMFVTEDVKRRVLDRLRPQLPLDAASFCLAASHTHAAPATDVTKPRLGAVDSRYVDHVVDQASQLLLRLAAAPPCVVRLSYAQGRADHAVNRRRKARGIARHLLRRDTLWAPDPAGPRDETLHVLAFRDASARIAALVWCYACHPVVFSPQSLISADYPGVVRQALRKAVGANIPILFLQGFAGDVRPRDVGGPRSVKQRVKELVGGPLFSPYTETQFVAWSGSLAERVKDILTSAAGDELEVALASRHARLPLVSLMDGSVGDRTVTFQRISLGPRWHIVAVSAEPVVDYVGTLSGILPGTVLPIGYIDTVFGYLPSARMLREGGYEVRGFMKPFGLSGRFRPDVEEVVRRTWPALG